MNYISLNTIHLNGGSGRGSGGGSGAKKIAQLVRELEALGDSADLLFCGQPPILYGKGTPQEAIVPDNWEQLHFEEDENGEIVERGYNWNGQPSALGQQYINTTVTSGGKYIAVRDGEFGLKWQNV